MGHACVDIQLRAGNATMAPGPQTAHEKCPLSEIHLGFYNRDEQTFQAQCSICAGVKQLWERENTLNCQVKCGSCFLGPPTSPVPPIVPEASARWAAHLHLQTSHLRRPLLCLGPLLNPQTHSAQTPGSPEMGG